MTGPLVAVRRRHEERVTDLELFFDLVFVLGFTQCTALMAAEHDWHGLLRGLLLLGLLWWAWVGYAWLTSVVDPEAGAVRAVVFVAMGGLLVAGLCVPRAFGGLGHTFVVAYAVVRAAHLALFLLTSWNDPVLRRSVRRFAVTSALGVGLLAGGSFLTGSARDVLWLVAVLLDMGGPLVLGVRGWTLQPGHFAERLGLILVIALGESFLAIGVGAKAGVTAGVVVAAVVGVGLGAALWWAYFDSAALLAERRLEAEPAGSGRNEMARDAYSFLHFPMIAGIILVALGLKTTLGHVGDPLPWPAAVALVGGYALYLLAHVGFRWRTRRTVGAERLVAAVLLLAALPAAGHVPALATACTVAAVGWALVAYEGRYGGDRPGAEHTEP